MEIANSARTDPEPELKDCPLRGRPLGGTGREEGAFDGTILGIAGLEVLAFSLAFRGVPLLGCGFDFLEDGSSVGSESSSEDSFNSKYPVLTSVNPRGISGGCCVRGRRGGGGGDGDGDGEFSSSFVKSMTG